MGQPTFHIAADGYLARDAQSWTEEKLMILEAYLNAFAKACQKVGGWYALDPFAGTGLNWSTTRDAPVNGSALIALEAEPPCATKVIIAERHLGRLPLSNTERRLTVTERSASPMTPT